MKILYIIPYVPYPLNSGGNQAFYNMANAIRKEHDVSLLLYIHSSEDRRNMQQLQAQWEDVKFYPYSDIEYSRLPVSNMSKKDAIECNLFNWIGNSMERKIARRIRKYEVKSTETEKTPLQLREEKQKDFDLGEFVRENSCLFRSTSDLNENFLKYVYEVSRKGFDAIQVEFYEYMPLVYFLPKETNTIFVHHELRFIRNKNEYDLFSKKRLKDRLILEQQKNDELGMLSHYNHIIVLTETDKAILKEHLPTKDIYVSPALTNNRENNKDGYPFKEAAELVFVGGGAHFPNADGVLWFCKEVMPELQKISVVPTIHIVGKWEKNIKKIIQKEQSKIHFAGFVENLEECINGKITIVPIRIGSGMRMKIMDAIAANAPMVTTSKGCEGIPLQNGTDCFIADSAKEFAEGIKHLINNHSLQKMFANNAHDKLSTILSNESLLERRLAFYRNI